MEEASVSTTEYALENQFIGNLQVRVAVICGLVQMCDGYDIGSIGWSVPLLTRSWHVAPAAFALAFLWSNIGLMAGALLAGPIGDRIGRKPLLMISVTVYGIASLASALSPSLEFLAGTRFLTGAGIAGGFAGTVAMIGDYSPKRRRAMMTMLTLAGAPLGGFVGGQLVAFLLSKGADWPIIFIIGGVFPLVLLAIMAVWLPESPRFLVVRTDLAPRQRALLRSLEIIPSAADANAVDVARSDTIRMLFGEGFALQTTLLWVIFFCGILNLFLFIFWLPEVLHLLGLTPAQSVFATSLYTLGGVLAALYLGWMIDRFGARALSVHFAVGIVFILAIALVAMPYFVLLIVLLLAGVTVVGSQTGSGAASGKLYPARMRTSGYGFAAGFGRLGGIVAAPLGGLLLACGLPPAYVFLSACLFAAIASVAIASLPLPGGQAIANPYQFARWYGRSKRRGPGSDTSAS